MKLVVLDGYTENPGDLSWEALRAFGEVTIYERTSYVDAPIIAERLQDADIAVVNKTPITKQTLDACPHLKLICVLATGYNVVDCACAKEKGIPVCNVPAYGTASVSQFAIALLLELCHHIGHHSETVHAGRWANNADWCYWDYPMVELAGKTIGIIGFGRIGQATGRIAAALGMRVLAHSPHESDEGRRIGTYVDLDTLLRESDVISLHCPLTPETHHMIDADAIKMMRDSAILVNTSRGGLIDTHALIDALRQRKFAGVGLDVYETEDNQIFEDYSDDVLRSVVVPVLLSFPNVVITSHQAFFTRTALQSIAITTMENARAFARGEKLVNLVE